MGLVWTYDDDSVMRLIPRERICQELGVSPRVLADWARRGRFPSPITEGKRAYYLAEELDQWRKDKRNERV